MKTPTTFKSNITAVRSPDGIVYTAIMVGNENDSIRILKDDTWEVLTDRDSMSYAFKVFGKWDKVIAI